ncbi:Cyclin-T2 [Merluccius polli]|uniref:Cyclin-T2 n=1 Tax=Merluccius polli TaxID=89951 RepID=A0AA47N9J8_MERPO|nr:Cyclin-T2 [Merluccius polli]
MPSLLWSRQHRAQRRLIGPQRLRCGIRTPAHEEEEQYFLWLPCTPAVVGLFTPTPISIDPGLTSLRLAGGGGARSRGGAALGVLTEGSDGQQDGHCDGHPGHPQGFLAVALSLVGLQTHAALQETCGARPRRHTIFTIVIIIIIIIIIIILILSRPFNTVGSRTSAAGSGIALLLTTTTTGSGGVSVSVGSDMAVTRVVSRMSSGSMDVNGRQPTKYMHGGQLGFSSRSPVPPGGERWIQSTVFIDPESTPNKKHNHTIIVSPGIEPKTSIVHRPRGALSTRNRTALPLRRACAGSLPTPLPLLAPPPPPPSTVCCCSSAAAATSSSVSVVGSGCGSVAMSAHRGPSSKWLFSREQLESTPSRRCGVESDRELSYRQQAANLIQDMGQRLNEVVFVAIRNIVFLTTIWSLLCLNLPPTHSSQLIINTAIVYMHRFYMIHSFTKFHRNIISQTTLFLAAKVEEQPRKLEHVIKVAHACVNPQEPPLDTKGNAYHQQAQELVFLETIVLQTLGFEITVEHPHTDVVRCSQLVRGTHFLLSDAFSHYYCHRFLFVESSFLKQGFGSDFLFHGYQQVVILSPYCTVTAHYSFL